MNLNQNSHPLKVVIDARMIGRVGHGFARYVTRMAEGLSKLRDQNILKYEPVFLIHDPIASEALSGFPTVQVASAFLKPRELIEIPRVLRELKASLYHSPTFSSLSTWPKPACPWVSTVHDLNHLTYGNAAQRLYYRFVLKPFFKKAAAKISVSEFSRHEIAEWAQTPGYEIEIVYNAISSDYLNPPADAEKNEILKRCGVESRKFFLCLSNPKPHKNLPLLFEAYREYREKTANPWPLVVSVSDINQPGVIALGGLDDRAVRVLLDQAGAVLFPSLYEGFGLPPVEAAASGTPVIVSDIPPHREGLRDLRPDEAVWLDPRESAQWTAAMEHATEGHIKPVSRESRTRIVSRFSVEEMGRRMDRIYRSVLGLPL